MAMMDRKDENGTLPVPCLSQSRDTHRWVYAIISPSQFIVMCDHPGTYRRHDGMGKFVQ